MNIRLPHITGSTNEEKIAQIVSYLRELAIQLERIPETDTGSVTEKSTFTDGVTIASQGETYGRH